MELLKQRILSEGRALNEHVLLVDSFLNHQVDVKLMKAVGEEFARLFEDAGVTRIATIESSGIAPAAMTALAMDLPLVILKKSVSSILKDGIIQREVFSFTKNAPYLLTLKTQFVKPGDRVLDVGTGPGFFACILSEEGLEVTAIDQSAGMLEKARENAAKLGVHPTFMHMNVNQMDFLDESFDVIVNRNVTSTLQYPEKLYAEFKRVLKPGGMLLIYDANWHAHLYDPELMKKVRAREEAHFRKYGTREVVTEDNPEFLATCPMTRYKRPEWDERVLTDLGFILNFL